MPSRPRLRRADSTSSSFIEPLETRRMYSVAGIEVGASAWATSFRESLRDNGLGDVGYRVPAADVPANLPWSRLDQITVKFDGPADDAQFQDLLVSGVRVSRYAVADMTYDPATFTATWTLARVVSNDKLLVRLRAGGGVFQTRLNILAGDVNQSGGIVNGTDLRAVQAMQVDDGTAPALPVDAALAAFCDVDGSGAVDGRDVTSVRARLLTHLPYREPRVVLPDIPNSDGWLGTVMNASHFIASEYHLPNVPEKLSLITDLAGAGSWEWVQAISRLRTARPNLLVGMYHSSRDAQYADTLTTYPPRAVPREGLTASQILMPYANNPNAVIVDFSQPAARRYLVDHIVRDVVRSGRPLAYLDNVSHHETGFPLPWAMTMALVRDITTNLHAMGKRAIVNAAWVPGYTTMESVDQFIATGADGIALEMGFYEFVRNNVVKIETAMAQYRKMLDAELAVMFVPNAAGMTTGAVEYLEAEQRLLAAFSMMFRKPGDRLFVSQIFWRPTPEWTEWPEQFGDALGDATIATNAQGQIEMTRRFTNYTLKLNTATKEVSATPTVRAAFAPVERGASQGV